MSCHCHGKNGEKIDGHVPPTSQCTACARKHLSVAWNLFTEVSYEEDNRSAIAGQLRLCMWHLMTEHRDVALKVRDLAVMIEENRDKEITDEWNNLLHEISELFYHDNPEAEKRLEELKNDH